MFDQVYFFLVWFCDKVCLLIFEELGMRFFFPAISRQVRRQPTNSDEAEVNKYV